MKSKFAKFSDAMLGGALIFLAATAIMRYYTVGFIAAFCGAAITACIMLIFAALGKKREKAQRLSQAAQAFFFELMFYGDAQAAELLCRALKKHEPQAVRRGNGVYLNSSAVFCCFEKSGAQTFARLIKRAERAGIKTVTFLTRTESEKLDLACPVIKYASGEKAYELFASLNALPDKAHTRKTRGRFFSGALDKNRLPRYAALSAALFTVSYLLGWSALLTACAAVNAALFLATAVHIYIRSKKRR